MPGRPNPNPNPDPNPDPNPNQRVALIAMACRMPVAASVGFIYPRLFALDDLADQVRLGLGLGLGIGVAFSGLGLVFSG